MKLKYKECQKEYDKANLNLKIVKEKLNQYEIKEKNNNYSTENVEVLKTEIDKLTKKFK